MKNIFITGVAGFIGSNLAKRILKEEKHVKVIGLDNMNDYYDVKIKEWRLEELNKYDKTYRLNSLYLRGFLMFGENTV